MDEKDEVWLREFNEKEEGSSGSSGVGNGNTNGILNGNTNGNVGEGINGHGVGRGVSRNKGKDREKDQKETMTPLKIEEQEFEYIVGMFEHWTEKHVPMLHTVSSCFLHSCNPI